MSNFKVGAMVVRKPEFQSRGGWPHGDKIVEVLFVGSCGNVKFVGDKAFWTTDRFTLATPVKQNPKAGEYWRQRNDLIVGPLMVHERTGMLYDGPYRGVKWFPTGVYFTEADSPDDLIERVECCPTCGKVKG